MRTQDFKRRIFDVTLGAVLITAGAFGLAHLRESGLWPGSSDERSLFISVGNLISQAGNVRYRFSDSAVWHDVSLSEHVAFGDSIFTAKDSHAEIRFKSGKTAEILPNSLVVIREPDTGSKTSSQAPLIDIQKGHVRLTHVKGSGAIRVAALGKIYEIVPQATSGSSALPTSEETSFDVGLPEAPPPSNTALATDAPMAVASATLVVKSDTPVVISEVHPDVASDEAKTPVASQSRVDREPAQVESPPTLSSPMSEPTREKPPIEVGGLAQNQQNQTVSPAPLANSTQAIQGTAPLTLPDSSSDKINSMKKSLVEKPASISPLPGKTLVLQGNQEISPPPPRLGAS